MTDDQLRKIAERVRYALETGTQVDEWDRRALAHAYLAEHPADGAEPITAEWLDTLTRDKEGPHHWRLADGPRAAGVIAVEVVLRPTYCTVEVCGRLLREWWPLADDAQQRRYTRGDLCRLCAALGFPLHPAALEVAACPR